jgi:predicted enzyme involved in methoxymalonyl-ACP biosynthesis
VSVLFGRIEAATLTLDGWLMSCRVLNRGVERLLLNAVVTAARHLAVTRIVGSYIPTDRNGLVKSLYPDLGFSTVGEQEGATTWCLDLEHFTPLRTFITLREQ